MISACSAGPCTTCGAAIIDSEDLILLSVQSCAECELDRQHQLYKQRIAACLENLLDDDTLFAVLLCAGQGRGGHRTACAASAVSRRFRALASNLFQSLCELSMGCMGVPQPAPSWPHEWRLLHRTLCVPLRWRARSWGAWQRRRSRDGTVSSGVARLRLDPAAPTRLTPGYGFSDWARADHLLERKRFAPLLHSARALCVSEPPPTEPRLLCVLRERSATHLLLTGLLTPLSTPWRRALAELPPGSWPADDEMGETEMRCVCCATALRHSRCHGGAVPTKAAKHLLPCMREADSLFKDEIRRWCAESGCEEESGRAQGPEATVHAATASAGSDAVEGADEDGEDASEKGPHVSTACLDRALVCPNGHVLLLYHLWEPDEDSASGESEGGESEESLGESDGESLGESGDGESHEDLFSDWDDESHSYGDDGSWHGTGSDEGSEEDEGESWDGEEEDEPDPLAQRMRRWRAHRTAVRALARARSAVSAANATAAAFDY